MKINKNKWKDKETIIEEVKKIDTSYDDLDAYQKKRDVNVRLN